MNLTCNICGKLIKHGNAYVTIVRNVEHFENVIVKNHEEITVIDSEELVTFCDCCGNKFNANTLKQIM